MAKRKSKRPSGAHRQTVYQTTYFKVLVLTTIVALFILGVKSLANNTQQPTVLGASSFIADNQGGDQPDQSNPNSQPQGAPAQTDNQNQGVNFGSLKRVEFQTENGHNQFNLQQNDSSIEISSEGGQLSIKAKKPDGTEVQLRDNSLNQINDALQNQNVEIATTSGNGFLLKKGQFEAETHFPLSINPATNQLTVTTPAGVKNVAVLPDQAVENLLRQKFISKVSATTTATSGAQLQLVTLGLLNNQPTFQVDGVSYKKLFGFIPVGINKIAYVSAENGQVLQTNESFLSQLFDLLSVQ